MGVLISNGQARGLCQDGQSWPSLHSYPESWLSPAGLGPKSAAPMAPRTLRHIQAIVALVVVTVFFSLLALFVVGKFSSDFCQHLLSFCAKVPRHLDSSLLDISAL